MTDRISAGEVALLKNIEGMQENRTGGVERESCCWESGYSEVSSWVAKLQTKRSLRVQGGREFIRQTLRRPTNPVATSRRRRKKGEQRYVKSRRRQDCVSAHPMMIHLEQKKEEDEKNMQELECSQGATLALHMCHKKCKAKGFKIFDIAAVVSEHGGAAHTINFCKNCYNERQVKQGEAEVNSVKWRR